MPDHLIKGSLAIEHNWPRAAKGERSLIEIDELINNRVVDESTSSQPS
jgi:hypothetical protein